MQSGKSKRDRKHGLKRVLVVEDDAVMALVIDAALRDAGIEEVVVCPSTACTMEALEEGPADAIVLDVHLADSDDGWALAELVAMLGPKPPRIVFSTASPGDIPPEIAEMGAIFEKPYDPAELARVLVGGAQGGIFRRLRDAIG